MTIIRRPTSEELDTTPITSDGESTGFIPIGYRGKRSFRDVFEEELSQKEQEALKKHLPFARNAARYDFNKMIKDQVEAQLREYGYVKFPEKISTPEMNWKKYMDPKNFEVINEKEVVDEYLTRINPGMQVTASTKVYKFKGFSEICSVMEDGPSSLRRAISEKRELEKIQDEISQEQEKKSKKK